MIWIGDRTRQPDHAHVEFCRGIKNPIGLKCGPSLDAGWAAAPDRHAQSEGRAGTPDAHLPLRPRQGRRRICRSSIRAVKKAGRSVVWSCDPMHGNTISAANGYKTRPFDRILKESRGVLRGAPRRGHARRRHPRRDDGPERDRVHGRRHGDFRARISRTATTRTAIRASTPTRRWNWLSLSPSN